MYWASSHKKVTNLFGLFLFSLNTVSMLVNFLKSMILLCLALEQSSASLYCIMGKRLTARALHLIVVLVCKQSAKDCIASRTKLLGETGQIEAST